MVESSLADDGLQSTAGSALWDKASLHFKQGARMISPDDLATGDGVLVGSRGEREGGRRGDSTRLALL